LIKASIKCEERSVYIILEGLKRCEETAKREFIREAIRLRATRLI
jgi:hypothetical protein